MPERASTKKKRSSISRDLTEKARALHLMRQCVVSFCSYLTTQWFIADYFSRELYVSSNMSNKIDERYTYYANV